MPRCAASGARPSGSENRRARWCARRLRDYDARTDRLSEAERLRMLDVLDRWRKEHKPRSPESVEAELREIRQSRRESSLRRARYDDPS